MDDLTLKDIYNMYRRHISDDGQMTHQLIGRVMHDGVQPEVLADYFGLLQPLTDHGRSEKAWKSYTNHAYFDAVPLSEIANGNRPDLIPEVKSGGEDPNGSAPEPARPPSKFLYQHQGMNEPAFLEVVNGMARLNGDELAPEQYNRILENLQGGHATIRYHFDGANKVLKMENVFSELLKIEPHLEEALNHLRAAADKGHIDPKVLHTLQRELFKDPMIPAMGNKRAYNDFLTRPREGVHVHMDGNDFGSINKLHGHAVGDEAIKAMGNAIVEAKNEAIGSDKGKAWRSDSDNANNESAFRSGGDEFLVHAPSHEHAANFARVLRQKLDAIPAIGGTHKLSMSIGMGHNPESAEQALIQAKGAKKSAGYQQGHAKTHAHSMIPGSEGPVPVETSVPHMSLPPRAAAPESAPAPAVPGPHPHPTA